MGYKNKEQQREYTRRWIANRRAEFFADKKCAVCGSKESLELDHIDPSKKVSHNIWSWNEERRLLEISKCQVLCKIHHLEKTRSELLRPITHGNSGYDRKCRCGICRAAHSNRMKARIRK